MQLFVYFQFFMLKYCTIRKHFHRAMTSSIQHDYHIKGKSVTKKYSVILCYRWFEYNVQGLSVLYII